MSMWMRLDCDLARHEKMVVLRTSCGLPRDAHATAYGCVVALLSRLVEDRSDGNIAAIPAPVIEEWAYWPGAPGVFDAAFRKTFCTNDIIDGWWRNAKLRERLDADAARKRRERSAQRPTDIRRTEHGPPPGVRGMSAVNDNDNDNDNENDVVVDDDGSDPDTAEVVRETDTDDPGKVARLLAVAANRAIAERWGEQPTPVLATSAQSHEAARAVIAAGVPVLFARDVIHHWCAHTKAHDRPPYSLKYFVPLIEQAWQRRNARLAARQAPAVVPSAEVAAAMAPAARGAPLDAGEITRRNARRGREKFLGLLGAPPPTEVQ
jgi:hypothetical protein